MTAASSHRRRVRVTESHNPGCSEKPERLLALRRVPSPTRDKPLPTRDGPGRGGADS